MSYEMRVLSLVVVPKDQPLFSEMATEIGLVDEAGGGEFVEVRQTGRTDVGKICINPEEWPTIRDAIDQMVKECREDKD